MKREMSGAPCREDSVGDGRERISRKPGGAFAR